MKPSNPYNIDIVYYNIVLCCSSISVQSTVSQPSQRCTREQLVDVKTAYIEANTAWNITDTKLLVTSTPVCTWTTIHAAVYTQYSLKQKWFVQQKGTEKKNLHLENWCRRRRNKMNCYEVRKIYYWFVKTLKNSAALFSFKRVRHIPPFLIPVHVNAFNWRLREFM